MDTIITHHHQHKIEYLWKCFQYNIYSANFYRKRKIRWPSNICKKSNYDHLCLLLLYFFKATILKYFHSIKLNYVHNFNIYSNLMIKLFIVWKYKTNLILFRVCWKICLEAGNGTNQFKHCYLPTYPSLQWNTYLVICSLHPSVDQSYIVCFTVSTANIRQFCMK